MSRPVTRRAPQRNGGFSWGRFPMDDTGAVAYRLFRRDHRGALHTSILNFYPRDQRCEVALALRQACHRLRDRVDEIDLAAMEVAA
ncbi:hypothetical protein [Stenotrophomonas sp.]|uniref:hypothetical protein n=1 Tax=Stenotrophomonas sp. TaxID=69392 RepID=UPI0028A7640F|nr:hypothetical protein [Stenotrophomonas sp.]